MIKPVEDETLLVRGRWADRDLIKKRDNAVCQDYEDGINIYDLVYKYQTTYATIRGILQRRGVFKKRVFGTGIPNSEQDQEELYNSICNKIRSGSVLKDVAQDYDMHVNTLTRFLNRMSGSRNRAKELRYEFRKDRIATVMELTLAGWYVSEIAEELQINPSTVYGYIDEYIRTNR